MKRVIFLTIMVFSLCFGSTNSSWAQEADTTVKWSAPDYEIIAKQVMDIASPYYYPKLMTRYEKGDTTLTREDFRYLYYGYPSQLGYKPLLNLPYADSLSVTFSKKTILESDDYMRVVEFARKTLAEEPFSMRDLNVLAFAYKMLEEPERARVQMFKLKGVLDAIRSTGMGVLEKSPWYVTYMRDAQDVLNLIGANYSKFIVISRSVQFVPVYNMPNKKEKGYYFDYSEIYRRRPDYLDELPKQKRKMEINPLYNPKSTSYILHR